MTEREVIPAPPLADWFVIGRAIVVRTFGLQERNGVRFWSALLSPLYPNYQTIDYRLQFYATIFREEYFELANSVQDGDELIVQGILQPRTETGIDGRVRGTITLRLTHFELAPNVSIIDNENDDYALFDQLSNDDEDEDDDEVTIMISDNDDEEGSDDESRDPFA